MCSYYLNACVIFGGTVWMPCLQRPEDSPAGVKTSEEKRNCCSSKGQLQHCRACVDNSSNNLRNISNHANVALRAQASTCNTSAVIGRQSFLTLTDTFIQAERIPRVDFNRAELNTRAGIYIPSIPSLAVSLVEQSNSPFEGLSCYCDRKNTSLSSFSGQ